MEDNLYTSTEGIIKIPKGQADKLSHEKVLYERERPLTTAVMERLEKDIAAREKVDFIKNTADPEAFMREVEINRQVCSILRRELNFLKGKARMYDSKKLR